jgi:flagellar basal body-associated protein FliL
MEKGKFGNFTTNQLQKRKKYALILLVILIAAVVLDVSALIYILVIGKGFHNTLFVTAAACIVILIPIYIGKKKIEGELKNREDN